MARSAPLVVFLVALVAGAGCGGSKEAAPPTRETWVVDQLLVPTTAVQATADGFDLDGDGTVDNQLGSVLNAMAQAAGSGGLDFQGATDAAIDAGATVQLVETLTGSATSVTLRGGTPAIAPCTVPGDLATCGRHLDGSTHFTAAAPAAPPLPGGGTSASFQAGPGPAVLLVPLFGGATVALPLVKARAAFTRSGTVLTGKIGGAIPQTSIDTLVLPALQAWIATAVARDCPGGTCTAGSTGETLLALFDANADGAVTVDELRANALITSLLVPDTPDGLSVGFGYRLVGAVY